MWSVDISAMMIAKDTGNDFRKNKKNFKKIKYFYFFTSYLTSSNGNSVLLQRSA
jgi:hypothetical protein